MRTDWRALCAELVAAWDSYSYADGGDAADRMAEAVCTTRAALAEPQGEVAIGVEWQPCVKRPITVHVREQRPGEHHVSTREGITPLRSDDLIMRGVQGEEYPIGRDLFLQTYDMGCAPQPASPEPQAEELTDEEIDACADEFLDWNKEGVCAFARAAIAADRARWGRPAAPPAAGEVAELVAQLRTRQFGPGALDFAAVLLERQQLQSVAEVRYEFSVFNSEHEWQAGGDAQMLEDAQREGAHYLAQYLQDGEHYLELRRVEILHLPTTTTEATDD